MKIKHFYIASLVAASLLLMAASLFAAEAPTVPTVPGAAAEAPAVEAPSSAAMPSSEGELPPKPSLDEKFRINKPSYVYKSFANPDPFDSIIRKMVKKGAPRNDKAPPLERYDIMQMRLVAVVSDDDKHYALVGLPDKKFFTVNIGTRMGIRSGMVHRITDNAIIVRETVINYRGEEKVEDTELKLRTEEGK